MIKIMIQTNGEDVYDEFKNKNSTLLENAIVLRRLEEIKQRLLSIEYISKLEISEDEDEEDDDEDEEDEEDEDDEDEEDEEDDEDDEDDEE